MYPEVLKTFPHRLDEFSRIYADDLKLISIGKRILSLYTDYPTRAVWDSYDEEMTNSEADFLISPSQYLSLIWNCSSDVVDDICTSLDSDISAGGSWHQATSFQVFDQRHREETHKLDFEGRLFPLLNELIVYLYTL